jgi:hypothetical protein
MDSLNDTAWVRTRADLVTYIRQLSQEALATSSDWENQTLDRYLEALSAWANDMDGYFINRGEPVPSADARVRRLPQVRGVPRA